MAASLLAWALEYCQSVCTPPVAAAGAPAVAGLSEKQRAVGANREGRALVPSIERSMLCLPIILICLGSEDAQMGVASRLLINI